MSRSKPKLHETTEDKQPFAEGFPVGRSVCGCYLKKISVVEKYHVDDKYYQIRLMFLHERSQKWITKFINDKPRSAFKSNEDFNESKLNVAKNLENLMACYLSGAHIKHIMFQTQISGLVNKMEEIQEALTNKRFWDVEVCLKTLPNSDGGVSVARYSPYMNIPGNSAWTLAYSRWESDRLKDNLKK